MQSCHGKPTSFYGNLCHVTLSLVKRHVSKQLLIGKRVYAMFTVRQTGNQRISITTRSSNGDLIMSLWAKNPPRS